MCVMHSDIHRKMGLLKSLLDLNIVPSSLQMSIVSRTVATSLPRKERLMTL